MDCIENIWVKTDDLLIDVIYNPPVRREFLEQFEQVLDAIFLSEQKCPILGDINIHCIYTLVRRTMAKEHVNLIHFEGLNPPKFDAKPSTQTTISPLDHIHSNFASSSSSGSIAVDIANQLPVFFSSFS